MFQPRLRFEVTAIAPLKGLPVWRVVLLGQGESELLYPVFPVLSQLAYRADIADLTL